MNATGNALAPSEIVLLHGEQFSAAGGLLDKRVRLLHTGTDVAAKPLGEALLAVALLANEQAGALRLQMQEKAALFGLTKTQTLYADPTGATVAWPACSLEAQLCPLAVRLRADKGKHEVDMLVHALLQHDSADPWRSVADLVQAGLAQRGMLQAREERKLLVRVVHYELPPATAALAATQPAHLFQQLLADSARARPDLHRQLLERIDRGLRRRVEQSTSV